jgi:hypothetical protein
MHAAKSTAGRAPLQSVAGGDQSTRTTCRQWWSELYRSGGVMVRERAANGHSTIYHVYSRQDDVTVLCLSTHDLDVANREYNDLHDHWYHNCR